MRRVVNEKKGEVSLKRSRSDGKTLDTFFLSYVAGRAVALPLTSPALLRHVNSPLELGSDLTILDLFLSDPGIVAKVIAAGWARHGRPTSMSEWSPKDFAAILGPRYVANLVTDSPTVEAQRHESDISQLWAHFVAVGYTAGQLAAADSLTRNCIEAHYFCGLCHDIGFVVELLYDNKINAGFAESMVTGATDVEGSRHENLGQALAKHWTFPPRLANTITSHHSGPSTQFLGDLRNLVVRMTVADRLFHMPTQRWLDWSLSLDCFGQGVEKTHLLAIHDRGHELHELALQTPIEAIRAIGQWLSQIRNAHHEHQ